MRDVGLRQSSSCQILIAHQNSSLKQKQKYQNNTELLESGVHTLYAEKLLGKKSKLPDTNQPPKKDKKPFF